MTNATLLNQAKHYLLNILGPESISSSTNKLDDWATAWTGADHLPFFLQNAYIFYGAKLFHHPCLLMLARTPQGETPAAVRKHWQAVSKHFQGDVIYLIEATSSYNRKRLIEQRVPFLVPGNQLYLPGLGIDLREYFKSGRQAETTRLSAPAQALLLREILQHDCSGLPAKDLAQKLDYSPMTITRAIKELTDRQLAAAEKIGREKHLSFPFTGRALWLEAQGVLQSPVTKHMWIVLRNGKKAKSVARGPVAGESALAYYTDLAATGIDQRAITAETWTALAKQCDVEILAGEHPKDRNALELELWAYNPDVIAPSEGYVDPLSLWLSLKENADERIEMARETLLDGVWSRLRW